MIIDDVYDEEKVDDFLDGLRFTYESGEVGMGEMLTMLYEFDIDGEWTDGQIFGEDYSSEFKFRFEIIKSVSEIIKKEMAESG